MLIENNDLTVITSMQYLHVDIEVARIICAVVNEASVCMSSLCLNLSGDIFSWKMFCKRQVSSWLIKQVIRISTAVMLQRDQQLTINWWLKPIFWDNCSKARSSWAVTLSGMGSSELKCDIFTTSTIHLEMWFLYMSLMEGFQQRRKKHVHLLP